MRATIEPREKSFSLMIGKREIGSAKNDSDARFHMHAINDVLDAGDRLAAYLLETTPPNWDYEVVLGLARAVKGS